MKYDKTNGVRFVKPDNSYYHTYKHLEKGLLKTKKITPPEPQFVEVEIPGMDGKLDITEKVYGTTVRYKNRILTVVLRYINIQGKWAFIYSDIMNKMHGKYFKKIRFDEDKEYYYKGRAYVADIDEQGAYADITIECDVDPYKYCDDSMATDKWKWDELNFENGVIVPVYFECDGTYVGTFINPYYEFEPEFTAFLGDLTLVYYDFAGNTQTYTVKQGVTIKGSAISTGETTFRLLGNGGLMVKYPSERRSL